MRHPSAELLSGRPGPRGCPLGSIDSEGCRTQATRHLSAALLSGQPALGGALLAPSLISQVPLSEYVSADRLG